jgi:hypothetical protein
MWDKIPYSVTEVGPESCQEVWLLIYFTCSESLVEINIITVYAGIALSIICGFVMLA